MSGFEDPPWSDGPNAPQIPYWQYFMEKADLTGELIASVLYGTLIVLFFQCMGALLDPVHRRGERVNWGLVLYTVIMFSIATALTAANLNSESVYFVIDPESIGLIDTPFVSPEDPRSEVLGMVPNIMFLLNYWLADGLLLYRCYVIYARNFWTITLPYLMYLASMGIGIMMIVAQARGWGTFWKNPFFDCGLVYLSIAVSLNVLLTLMIVIRLVMHGRSIRAAMGSPSGTSGLYTTIATMLIESSALYAVTSLLVIGLWTGGSMVVNTFLPILAEIQAIAPLLIIQRVANKSAFASNTIVAEYASSSNARTLREHRRNSAGKRGKNSDNFGDETGAETTVVHHRDSQA